MTHTRIQLHHVSKRYGSLLAVDDVSLTVNQGEILVLLGQSGCGKTTTLRLIAGLERPDSGELYLDGALVSGNGVFVPPEDRKIGMVFQDYALFPHLTLEANVAFGLDRWNASERRARVAEMLALVGLENAGKRYPHQISGGQQQRVALARALASRPAVVLLDEPFSNLDAALRKEMREEVRRILRAAHATAVFVTHDQQEALSLSDRVAMLHEGRLLQIDTPQHIYETPADAIVAAFIGESNFVDADAHGESAQSPLGEVPLRAPIQGAVKLLIRPEALEINGDADGVWGVVLWREYFGYEQRLGVALADGTTLTARADPHTVYQVDDRVRVSVRGAVSAFAG
jgi:iron(III) transport system ATP-binding protein